jgi:hypothetical protein
MVVLPPASGATDSTAFISWAAMQSTSSAAKAPLASIAVNFASPSAAERESVRAEKTRDWSKPS